MVDNQGMQKLSVLMPVYNEARTLRTIVERVFAAPIEMEIELVAVNDGSSDDSLKLLHDLAREDDRIVVVNQPRNMGKGMAIRTAIKQMTGDIGIVQDADLEYDPKEIPKVLAPILSGQADAVYGSRFAASEQRRVLFYWHSLGNRILTTLSNMFNDLNLTDMETCYKAVRGDLLKRLRFTSERFGFEPEITARLAGWGARIYEVPISYHGRTYDEGKNIGWRDGLEALWLVFKFRFIDTKSTEDDSVTTRQSLGRAPRYRRWILDSFDRHTGDSILEVNAGPGHTTSQLLGAKRLLATDSEPVHAETLQRRFGHMANVEVRQHDFADSPVDAAGFDTAILFDGLQRESDPKQLLVNVAASLEPAGRILIHVPSDASLHGRMDDAIGIAQRFDESSLRQLIEAAGLELVLMEPFNRAGAVAWKLVNARGSTHIGPFSARIYDLSTPFARRLDRVLPNRPLSWVAVARVI